MFFRSSSSLQATGRIFISARTNSFTSTGPLSPPKIVRSAAPAPLPRFERQRGAHRVLVNVVELFLTLLIGSDHEIVEAALPHMLWVERLIPQIALARVAVGTQAPEQAACESLLDGLHNHGGIASLRFTQQKMHVLGHDDIAGHDKMVAPAHLFEHLDE